MAGLGLLIAFLRTRRGGGGTVGRWWDRARGPVGMSAAVIGLLMAFVGLLFSRTAVWSHLLGLLPLAVAVGCATPFVGNQDWKNHPGSHP